MGKKRGKGKAKKDAVTEYNSDEEESSSIVVGGRKGLKPDELRTVIFFEKLWFAVFLVLALIFTFQPEVGLSFYHDNPLEISGLQCAHYTGIFALVLAGFIFDFGNERAKVNTMNLCIVALGWVLTINWESYNFNGKLTLSGFWLFLFISSAVHPAPPLEKVKVPPLDLLWSMFFLSLAVGLLFFGQEALIILWDDPKGQSVLHHAQWMGVHMAYVAGFLVNFGDPRSKLYTMYLSIPLLWYITVCQYETFNYYGKRVMGTAIIAILYSAYVFSEECFTKIALEKEEEMKQKKKA